MLFRNTPAKPSEAQAPLWRPVSLGPWRRLALAALVGLSRFAHAQAPGTPASTGYNLKLPTFPTEPFQVFLTVREGYDDNIFGTESAPEPGRSDIANLASWTTIIDPKFSLNLLPLLSYDKDGFLKSVNFSYEGQGTLFSSDRGEDNLRSIFNAEVKGLTGPWALSIDNTLVYVDGPKEDPFYATYSPLGYRAARDRRNQVDESNYSTLTYQGSDWFVRGVASALYYNMLIDEHNPVGAYKGYLNWINRDDIHAGTDFGYDLTKDLAFALGWRIGQQTQARTPFSLADSDGTYNRALFGFEGKPVSWLQVGFKAGPDWRRYSDGSNAGISGPRHTWFYTESYATATLSPADTFSFSNKVWHWVSASGLYSYQETTDTWSYRHAFTTAFSASAGFIIQGVRYDPPNVRNDGTTSYPVGLAYAFNSTASLSLDYLGIRGRSKIPSSIDPGRDWDETQAFLSLRVVQ